MFPLSETQVQLAKYLSKRETVRIKYLEQTQTHTLSLKHWVFFLGGGVRLSPLGASASNWLVLPALDDR
jgi:hypothetical protein